MRWINDHAFFPPRWAPYGRGRARLATDLWGGALAAVGRVRHARWIWRLRSRGSVDRAMNIEQTRNGPRSVLCHAMCVEAQGREQDQEPGAYRVVEFVNVKIAS